MFASAQLIIKMRNPEENVNHLKNYTPNQEMLESIEFWSCNEEENLGEYKMCQYVLYHRVSRFYNNFIKRILTAVSKSLLVIRYFHSLS